ncbi:hypothetical protein [Bradyrhizobium sp. CIR48]|uniref:hypothetical protein n=1 Tax=Bradyrhizobium sp. CIR48 TaxID=2663840 RepID=UPI0016064AE8|nr:hypothetical protein [Bradyrhizobium sp. CIR48]
MPTQLTCEQDAPVDPTQIAIVLLAGLIGPVGAAAEREWHPVPGDGDAVLELCPVLRMDGCAELGRAPHAFIRRYAGELEGISAFEKISNEQDAASALERGHRVVYAALLATVSIRESR